MSIEVENIKKASIGKNDTVIVRVDSILRNSETERIKNLMLETFPDNKVLIIGMGISIEILTPEDAG